MARFAVVLLLVPALALAQTTPNDFSPPPLVPADPPPVPAPEPGTDPNFVPDTPPPPGSQPPPQYIPGQQPNSGYPYSPYGTPKADEKPPVEWGLMLSESLFGMLTAAGVTLIPYFLLLRPMITQSAVLGDDTVSTVIFVLIFATVPLGVSQTQLSIANGSRYYVAESWPAALAGLGAQAAVLGLFFLLPRDGFHRTTLGGRSEALILIGSVVFTPLVQMAVINLTKSPRSANRLSAMSWNPKDGLSFGAPTPVPMIGQTRHGSVFGMTFSVLSGNF